ncbi:MAG: tetratricopeptide repeat protein [Spirochaetales bacterium]|nr:tetratricopeptide repeat protein [Spirochaetales bacterium]
MGANNNKIEILKTSTYPDTAENRELIENLIDEASLLMTRIYSDFVEISDKSQGSRDFDYSLATNYIYDPNGSVLQITLTDKNSQNSKTFNIIGTIRNDTPLFLARAIFYLWAGDNNYLADSNQPVPVYIEDLYTEYIQETVIPETPTMLMPMDIAVKPNGNLLGAFSMVSVEFDSNFKILGQPGRSLYEAGSYTSAAGLGLTPGGTVYLKPSIGRDIYRFSSDSEIGEKWRTGMDLYGPMTTLPDGSIVLIDIQKKKAVKIYNRKKTELNLFTSPYSYIAAVATGPEGNIWVYDITEQRIRIHTPEGEILDSIIPVLDTSAGMSPSALSVYKDGNFVIYYSNGEMYSFTRNGLPIWNINEIETPEELENLPQTAKIALDDTNGFIYIADLMGQRIIKLQDRAYVSKHNIKSTQGELLVGLNYRFLKTGDVSALAEKADYYESQGALELAGQTWERILDIDPDYEPAYDKLDLIKVEIMILNAEKMEEKTIIKLQNLGKETARNDYRRTIQLYERILSIDPDNNQIRSNKNKLEDLFDSGRGIDIEPPPFDIKSLTVENLFPSLMQYYQNRPVGNIELVNKGNSDIKNLEVSFFIKRFMDFPVFSRKITLIKPLETVNIDLNVLFNQEVLKLEEDLKVQINLELKWEYNNNIRTSKNNTVVTLYRRSAMQWDDTGKLSSFITPNERVVEEFSHRVISNAPLDYGFKFSSKFERAVRVTNSLSAFGISYVEDPASPITRILEDIEIVDTVRFPRKTLFIRSGDCDDTTALLASMLESAGIETAIMTSPGHVFLAFNSEEPIANRWMYESDFVTVIPYNRNLWIPIETTYLKEGFFKTWEVASREVKANEAEGLVEFIPLKEIRTNYPPLPLGESIYQVLEPDRDKIQIIDDESAKELRTELYDNLSKTLLQQLETANERKSASINNRLGILHIRFKNYRAAENVFKNINRDMPEYISAYVNLANLYRVQGKNEPAIGLLEKALKESPDSTSLNLVLAQCYYENADFQKAEDLFSMIKSQSPDLALKYGYLEAPGRGQVTIQRAAGAGENQPVFWDTGE